MPVAAPLLRANASELVHTRVVPVIDEAHDGKNLIYCASMPLAWKELVALHGGPIEIEGADAAAKLNAAAQRIEPSVIDEASYVARGGEGPQVIEAIRRELAEKFGGEAAPGLLPASVQPDAWLVYSYLFKSLVLETPLAREEGHGLSFQGRRVKHFGVWETPDVELHDKRARQVIVHDMRAEDDFVVELETKATGDRLLLARIPRAHTLAETAAEALRRAPARPGLLRRVTGAARLRRRDVFKAPLIDFDIAKSYGALSGKRIVGRDRYIDRADQQIRLRLDEKGALLRSEVRIGAPRGGGMGIPPRHLILDGPFLFLMARVEAVEPYLALWVDNDELLITSS